MKRFRMSEALLDVWKGVPQTKCTAPMYYIHQWIRVCMTHQWLPHIGELIRSKKVSFQTSVCNRYNIYIYIYIYIYMHIYIYIYIYIYMHIYIYICTYITEYSIESFFDNFTRPLRNFMSMFVCKNIEDEEVCVKARWTTSVNGCFYNFDFFLLEEHLVWLARLNAYSFIISVETKYFFYWYFDSIKAKNRK